MIQARGYWALSGLDAKRSFGRFVCGKLLRRVSAYQQQRCAMIAQVMRCRTIELTSRMRARATRTRRSEWHDTCPLSLATSCKLERPITILCHLHAVRSSS